MFEHELIKILTSNIYILNGLSECNGMTAIFPYYVPPKSSKPFLLFRTESYIVPTRSETKLLIINYVNDEIDIQESQKYSIEIVKCLDGLTLTDDKAGTLRFYLSDNPVFKDDTLTVNFMIRGNINKWGIV